MLWKRLVGKASLAVTVDGGAGLQAYAMCSRNDGERSVVLVLCNLQNTSINIDVVSAGQLQQREETVVSTDASRFEYILTATHGNLNAMDVSLNGEPLQLGANGGVPPLLPHTSPVSAPLLLPPLAYGFIELPVGAAAVCPPSGALPEVG